MFMFVYVNACVLVWKCVCALMGVGRTAWHIELLKIHSHLTVLLPVVLKEQAEEKIEDRWSKSVNERRKGRRNIFN